MPDRASELLQAHVLSNFFIPTSDISQDEIISRQGRAKLDTLTAIERDIKNGLMQGALPMVVGPSAVALFSAAELRELGITRFRDSSNRFKDCIYITELSRGEIDSLFPDEAALLRHRSKSQGAADLAASHA